MVGAEKDAPRHVALTHMCVSVVYWSLICFAFSLAAPFSPSITIILKQ